MAAYKGLVSWLIVNDGESNMFGRYVGSHGHPVQHYQMVAIRAMIVANDVE